MVFAYHTPCRITQHKAPLSSIQEGGFVFEVTDKIGLSALSDGSGYGVTVTTCDASGQALLKPVAVADTVVVPPESASKAMPPEAFVVGGWSGH